MSSHSFFVCLTFFHVLFFIMSHTFSIGFRSWGISRLSLIFFSLLGQIDFQSRLTVGVFDISSYTSDILQLTPIEYAYLEVANA